MGVHTMIVIMVMHVLYVVNTMARFVTMTMMVISFILRNDACVLVVTVIVCIVVLIVVAMGMMMALVPSFWRAHCSYKRPSQVHE